jgi:cytochrome c5
MNSVPQAQGRAVAFLLLIVVASNGCSHGGKKSATSSTPAVTGSNLTSTGTGRSIYTGKCTTCHSAKTITNYTAAQWQAIIPSMAKNAGLSSAETSALSDYVNSVLNNSSS